MGDHIVFVAYSQIHVAPAGLSPVFDPGRPPALAGVADAGRSLIVTTGINMGWVRVRIVDRTDPPPRHDWEEEATVQLDVEQTLYLTSPTVEEGNYQPVFQPERPGRHAVTVLARGRS